MHTHVTYVNILYREAIGEHSIVRQRLRRALRKTRLLVRTPLVRARIYRLLVRGTVGHTAVQKQLCTHTCTGTVQIGPREHKIKNQHRRTRRDWVAYLRVEHYLINVGPNKNTSITRPRCSWDELYLLLLALALVVAQGPGVLRLHVSQLHCQFKYFGLLLLRQVLHLLPQSDHFVVQLRVCRLLVLQSLLEHIRLVLQVLVERHLVCRSPNLLFQTIYFVLHLFVFLYAWKRVRTRLLAT